MNIKYCISILLISFLVFISFKNSTPQSSKTPWLTLNEAIALHKKKPKKILIDVYTDWCGWCKKMDKYTYTDSIIIDQLNKDYYLVKFNAEGKDSIQFRDHTFHFNQQYKSHDFAISLLQGKMSYPSTAFLDEELNLLTVVPGYLTPDQLSPILDYFGSNYYKTTSWEEFQRSNSKK